MTKGAVKNVCCGPRSIQKETILRQTFGSESVDDDFRILTN